MLRAANRSGRPSPTTFDDAVEETGFGIPVHRWLAEADDEKLGGWQGRVADVFGAGP